VIWFPVGTIHCTTRKLFYTPVKQLPCAEKIYPNAVKTVPGTEDSVPGFSSKPKSLMVKNRTLVLVFLKQECENLIRPYGYYKIIYYISSQKN